MILVILFLVFSHFGFVGEIWGSDCSYSQSLHACYFYIASQFRNTYLNTSLQSCCCASYEFVLKFIAVYSVNSRGPHGILACILLNV